MKIIATNRRAKYDYQIEDTLVSGVVLLGHEVKSVKAGHISLKGSYATINRGELYLINAHITPHPGALEAKSEPTRSRKLLVHKKQLTKIIAQKQAGLSLVPLSVGLERGFVKVELGIGRGQKKFDKRQAKQARDAERDMARRRQK
jgi:SsrA-binding protein